MRRYHENWVQAVKTISIKVRMKRGKTDCKRVHNRAASFLDVRPTFHQAQKRRPNSKLLDSTIFPHTLKHALGSDQHEIDDGSISEDIRPYNCEVVMTSPCLAHTERRPGELSCSRTFLSATWSISSTPSARSKWKDWLERK